MSADQRAGLRNNTEGSGITFRVTIIVTALGKAVEPDTTVTSSRDFLQEPSYHGGRSLSSKWKKS